ncbi:MAG: hypothetical protein GY710_22300 [Desulfobacteraceae bacterium]|nr:hypothetical protein [Desulfobacteraceae bacterium]
MLRNFVIFFGMIVLAGCTAMTVRPVDKSLLLQHICIQENPKVRVSDFITVLQDGFEKHGITTEVYSDPTSSNCEYILTYTALRSWDITPYLSHAEIRIKNQGRQVAYAEYHLKGKGGFSLTKWKGTKSKIEPVIDELLKAY